jgi:ubiquinone/menaquinone biosynthesis C-methylase UbiE
MIIKQDEIQAYFNKGQQERISLAIRNDAVGFNYQAKRSWFINYLRTINGTMLDIGCNNGNLAFLLRKQGVSPEQLNYIGIDIADESIECAKSRNIPGAVFQVGNALELDFPDESFDAVTLVEVIEHMPNQPHAIHEATRVLKPGGLFLLSTPNAECVPWLFDERLRFFARRLFGTKNVDKDSPLTLSALERILTEAGLEMIEGPRYYWYRPYHIFKGRLWWPPTLAMKGLLGAMKYCISVEESKNLDNKKRTKNCQSLLAAAYKSKIQ